MSPDFISARSSVVSALRQELVGPSPQGKELDCAGELKFAGYDAAEGPFRQQGSGEEILTGDRPLKRYGIAVLYPIGLSAEADPPATKSEEERLAQEPGDEESEGPRAPEVIGSTGRMADAPEDDDLPLSTANSMRPSSLGLSFVGEFPEGASLDVELTGARYVPREVIIERTAGEGGDRTLTWWLRQPVRVSAHFEAGTLTSRRAQVKPDRVTGELPEGFVLELGAMARPSGSDRSLVTVTAVNRSPRTGVADSQCLFQARLVCRPILPGGRAGVLPYEESAHAGEEQELRSLALLYRANSAFAVGHGCAADWQVADVAGRAAETSSASLPAVEVPSITPEIKDPVSGAPIAVPMAPLAGLTDGDDGRGSMLALIEGYAGWIREQDERIPRLDERHRDIAQHHLALCRRAEERMRDGLRLLDEDPDAAEAFKLANRAMLLQQEHSGHPPRPTTFNRDALRLEVEGSFRPSRSGRGSWRPFQIAFVLAALRSTVHKGDEARELVELIFFPTGGGKTEAYLGLTAFSIFYRRLTDPADSGVDVLMRYTLRLLTAQQFQRASALICAMETLRREEPGRLGEAAISIGVWLGGSVTPNMRADAVASLRQLKREGDSGENRFVLRRCPWCAAQMGPIKATGTGRQRGQRRGIDPKVAGYEVRGDTVALACPDSSCPFHGGLPVYVIDEDVYAFRPSLVIGTVDKFAMLAFRPEARALFGLGPAGGRELGPPNLIIQDELHLISGPLGSMVGLYESLIEELCTDHRGGEPFKPKIVGSTATIRRFERQIKDLYCREESALFPPRGLDASDSYFARYARGEDGKLLPGRMYMGIHGPGLGSIQTAQVRTFATLIQAAGLLPAEQQDPWWTLLVFFNSLRELGTSLSLLQSDIPDYLRVIRKRLGLKQGETRYPWNVLELTGRLRNDEVPRAIEELEKAVSQEGPAPVDVCLASNIVEVGVDIDRLSLMAVVGQPKTTSQYIQATGRIGRRWWERPGLVTTIYGASKPRDRSHFEKFRSYHERLYAQVEPTSVTPFAPPVLDRALHAILVAYVRQLGHHDAKPLPVPEDLLDSAFELLRSRVESIDPEEARRFEAKFAERVGQWRRWQRTDWMADWDSEDYGLLRFAGAYAERVAEQISWAVPTSMRNVDAECKAAITTAYLLDDETQPPAAAAGLGPGDGSSGPAAGATEQEAADV